LISQEETSREADTIGPEFISLSQAKPFQGCAIFLAPWQIAELDASGIFLAPHHRFVRCGPERLGAGAARQLNVQPRLIRAGDRFRSLKAYSCRKSTSRAIKKDATGIQLYRDQIITHVLSF
jgi:hypothetical protein